MLPFRRPWYPVGRGRLIKTHAHTCTRKDIHAYYVLAWRGRAFLGLARLHVQRLSRLSSFFISLPTLCSVSLPASELLMHRLITVEPVFLAITPPSPCRRIQRAGTECCCLGANLPLRCDFSPRRCWQRALIPVWSGCRGSTGARCSWIVCAARLAQFGLPESRWAFDLYPSRWPGRDTGSDNNQRVGGRRPRAPGMKRPMKSDLFGVVCWFVYMMVCLFYLYFTLNSSAVHSAGDVDCVSPDVILRPASPDYTSNYWTHVDTWSTKNIK